jgi:hypothetical protein
MRPAFAPGFVKSVSPLNLAVLALLAATTTSAGEPPVAVGEVVGSTPAGEFTEPLRSALTHGLAGAELRARERFVLSATLVRLDAERVGKGARATAQVSLVLRRAREQSLHAILSGHATAEEADGSVSETREDALRAAVSSALRRLPEAVR